MEKRRPELSQPPDSGTATGSPARLGRLLTTGNRLLWVATVVLLVVLAAWLQLTPDGLLGKADAVGYAVCHRITARSFLFPNGRQMPLCARCSGTFLGVLVGLFGPGLLFGRRRAGSFPPVAILAVMLSMSGLWAFDGANSFAHLFPAERIPRLYGPTNFLRLATGMYHGITMGSLILPVVNATLWADAIEEPVIARWRHLAALYVLGAVLTVLVLSGLGIFLYPLAFLSAAGVIAILTAISVVMVAAVLGREGLARTLADALPLIVLGLAVTLILIGGIDAARYALFGTWDGFVIPEAFGFHQRYF